MSRSTLYNMYIQYKQSFLSKIEKTAILYKQHFLHILITALIIQAFKMINDITFFQVPTLHRPILHFSCGTEYTFII